MDNPPPSKSATLFERLKLFGMYGAYLFLLYIWDRSAPHAVEGLGLTVVILGPFFYMLHLIKAAAPAPALSPRDQLKQQIALACDGQTDQTLRFVLGLLNGMRTDR